MKKLIVSIAALAIVLVGYTTYVYAMPKVIGSSSKVTYEKNNSNTNVNSDANENLIDGLKPLPVPPVYSGSQASATKNPIPAAVEPYLGKWIVKEQIGQNPYAVHGQSPIGKTITISQSQFIDNSKNPSVNMTNPYYSTITIPYVQLTQDYNINFYSQSGLPSQNLNVIIVNPNKTNLPIENPAFNADALFMDNGNLVVVDGSSFFLCTKE